MADDQDLTFYSPTYPAVGIPREPVFSRRCADEQWARYVAECLRKDSVRTGCTVEG